MPWFPPAAFAGLGATYESLEKAGVRHCDKPAYYPPYGESRKFGEIDKKYQTKAWYEEACRRKRHRLALEERDAQEKLRIAKLKKQAAKIEEERAKKHAVRLKEIELAARKGARVPWKVVGVGAGTLLLVGLGAWLWLGRRA